MDSKNVEQSNENGPQEKQTQEEPVVKIFFKDGNYLWTWRGVDGKAVEEIFQLCHTTQMRRNIKREILTELNRKKILSVEGMPIANI